MKHIKIFEEFTHDTEPQHTKIPMTKNEINLLQSKTGSQITTDSKDNSYLLFSTIAKIDDGFWLVNGKIQCSSIADVVKVCRDNYEAASAWYNDLIKDQKYHEKSEFFHITTAGKLIFVHSKISKFLKNEFNYNIEGATNLIKHILEKRFNLSGSMIVFDN